MKNYLYILSLIMLSGLLAACSNETTTSKNPENTQIKSSVAQSTAYSDTKETKDTAWLKEKALYQFEAMEGSDEYSVFLYAEDEHSVLKEEKNSGGKKQLFSGNYFIYLAEKDSTIAYKQMALGEGGTFTFNPSSNQAYSIKLGRNTIIVALESGEKGNYKPFFYSIKDGEMKEIYTDDRLDRIYGTEIKTINQKYLQTAELQENKAWKFETWEVDEETFAIDQRDESELEVNAKDLGDYWYTQWSERKELYYPFHNIELSHDMVDKAKQGIPLGSPYPIGTNIANIKKSEPDFMEEGELNGTPYLMYPEITYNYEKATGTVTAVSIPGERVKTTMDEIKKLLGKPEQEGTKSDGEIHAIYNADKYAVEVLAGVNGKVKMINLSKK